MKKKKRTQEEELLELEFETEQLKDRVQLLTSLRFLYFGAIFGLVLTIPANYFYDALKSKFSGKALGLISISIIIIFFCFMFYLNYIITLIYASPKSKKQNSAFKYFSSKLLISLNKIWKRIKNLF